uniref:Carbamoyl phosphate synthase small chain n=1 Tax=Symphyocladiella dendroidea TaxID=2506487 RepID=A0A1Z1M6S2_9FLOR|nr:carbamoyl phosphate synthase small subunit [Symphyocladiella dendroidea]ARW61788.1 carbamoyl phosphate synthase small subunit [Symphyocladiella dendroidea]
MSYSLYPTVLYLQDGTLYRGFSFFKISSSFGEVVFNTGMTGYQEIFSDPSYAGQMVVFTYPELGNTGLNKCDNESNFIHVKALIARNISSFSSSWRSCISLRDYIITKQIPHIFGLDTRSLTKHLRLFGVTNGVLLDAYDKSKINIFNVQSINNIDLVRKITSRTTYSIYNSVFNNLDNFNYNCINFKLSTSNIVSRKYKILVLDLGIKFNILRKLLLLGCNVFIVPATCNYSDILKYSPDGIVLSNGPGNPLLANYVIDTVKRLVKFSNIPIFGICMGHQILNIALGLQTYKLKFGHRGLNHPCGVNKYSEITSQNHGFAVNQNAFVNKNLLKIFSVKYFNLNDFTISSTFHKKLPILSVQYHPESSPGPHDSEYLFEVFIKLVNIVINEF